MLFRSILPTPRRHPLPPSSPKEISVIHYVDEALLRVYRRYGSRFTKPEAARDDAPGYTNIEQVITDLDPLLNVVWVSNTRKSIKSTLDASSIVEEKSVGSVARHTYGVDWTTYFELRNVNTAWSLRTQVACMLEANLDI